MWITANRAHWEAIGNKFEYQMGHTARNGQQAKHHHEIGLTWHFGSGRKMNRGAWSRHDLMNE